MQSCADYLRISARIRCVLHEWYARLESWLPHPSFDARCFAMLERQDVLCRASRNLRPLL